MTAILVRNRKPLYYSAYCNKVTGLTQKHLYYNKNTRIITTTSISITHTQLRQKLL